MTPLTVLKTSSASSPEQLVRLFHQSQLEWARHLGEETELDFGRWIDGPNCLLDALLLPGMKASDLIGEMANRSWQCCSLNPSAAKEQTAPLVEALLTAGWTACPLNILYRNQKTNLAVNPAIEGLKIIPARASYRHYGQLMEDRANIGGTPMPLAMSHLDDSHFDVLLALKDGNAIGSIGVLTSGEVGTIREWYVTPQQRHRGVGQLLLTRALEIATRGMLRHVMIGLPDSTGPVEGLCQIAGFRKIEQWASFWKDSCKSWRLFA
jgi:hypothetical protein